MDKKKFNAQEKKAWQKIQKVKLDSLNQQIQDIVNNYETNPEHIAELLSFSSNFYNYSARNTMLIYSQNRGATFVQSYDAWKKDGYPVLSGQKGLKIFVPVKKTYIQKESGSDEYVALSQATPEQKVAYKSGQLRSNSRTNYAIGNVFDISQTTCPPENYPQHYHMGYADQEQRKLISGLENYSRECLDTDVFTSHFDSISLRGSFFPIPVNSRYRIELNDRLEDTEALSTLTHELGHAVIHKNLPDSPIFQKELEADCFSVMLETHLSIDLTDGRKRHLTNHYQKLQKYNQDLISSGKEKEVISFEHIIGNVFKIYSNEIPMIDHYINNQLEHQKLIVYNKGKYNHKALEDGSMFNEVKKGSFNTIVYYINKEQQNQPDDITLYTSYKEAFEKYQSLEKAEHIRFGYFDQRDGEMHDLIHYTNQDILVKSTEEFTAGKDINNRYDFEIISSVFKISDYIKEQRLNHLEILAKEDPSFEPKVSILWSEHPLLKDGGSFSLSKAEHLLSRYDAEHKKTVERERDQSQTSYYKMQFKITFRMDGKVDTYQGRYNIGEGDGGLINHIHNFATHELQNSNIDPESINDLQWSKDRFIPFLKGHLAFSDKDFTLEQQLKSLGSNHEDIQYYKDFKKHIKTCRDILNNQDQDTPHPEAPQQHNHNMNRDKAVERLLSHKKTMPMMQNKSMNLEK